ncbi:sodium:sulfate symporter [Campylobacter jejuni]|nr:sodium:sulfate symporter [Campylobacter sp. BCW_4322]OEW75590.1 sodium:sulfate symporter [Campylobacter sp. BCW_4333]OEW77861.1 sodium:sulfate symporter [Campylobacter sp. BCW_4337]OEW80670.1 sodium:sulfate symporter [Campylobacter sp. BCW_4338]OEW97245.1 sodium:sulfate symporter [Campylobacter jejuni]
MEDNSWHFLGLFIAVIMAVILQVMPLGAVCMVAIAIIAHYPKFCACYTYKNS